MFDNLERLIDEVSLFNSRLIMLVGSDDSNKSQLMQELSKKLNIKPLNIGFELGRHLAIMPTNKRSFEASTFLRELISERFEKGPVLMGNLEILFEPSLNINPLELLKNLAHSACLVAVWPGGFIDERLVYADVSHPEHRNYSCDGIVVFKTYN